MKKFVLLLACITGFASMGLTQSADEAAVRNILNNQIISWNKGDMESFMGGYWKSDSLMFIGSRGLTYGWENTLNNYKKGYPDSASRGQLRFEVLEVKRLSVMYFFVVGKFFLTRTVGDVQGVFSLLFKKIKNKWVIVADHSS